MASGAKNLVIVESPAKAKTISRFLGSDYVVRASMGHVRDLPKSKMSIDVEHDFAPRYIIPMDKKKVVSELKGALKKGMTLWVATDEDREGEAIGWHLIQALGLGGSDSAEVGSKVKKGKKTKAAAGAKSGAAVGGSGAAGVPIKRIAFHEITEKAIRAALAAPREIDTTLVDAQQARRVLDRLVGYELSPLLWKKVRSGLSAGRVQSVAVRLIVDREREIQAFKTDEYWSIEGIFSAGGGGSRAAAGAAGGVSVGAAAGAAAQFKAALHSIGGKDAVVRTGDEARAVCDLLGRDSFTIARAEEKETKRTPAAPFTTSTLQQEAARKLGYSVKKTMMLAQQLYEGIDIDGEPTALITYMRTDSTNLSQLALDQSREVIAQHFGKEYVLPEPRRYKSKKGAQEAHEAIRPVDLSLHPDTVERSLSRDLSRLYELIWKRTIACQMAEARLKQVSVDVVSDQHGDYLFRATGQTIIFPGFMQVYIEGTDQEENAEEREGLLPPLSKGDVAKLHDALIPEQHFTKPPARYTEASLVKKLESEGIGRPSTYAPTISTILTRGYIEKDAKALKPTDLGTLVTDLLVAHFPNIVDYKFTAQMEDDLDEIAEGKKQWVPVIRAFYTPFHALIVEKNETLSKKDIITETTDEKCEKCGGPLQVKFGRFGKFYACSNYPECKFTRPIVIREQTEAEKELEEKAKGEKCEKCGAEMVVKHSRYGTFLGCSNYPKCKNIRPLSGLTGIKCTKCGEGELVQRRTRKGGRPFYGCNKYPKCDFALWDKPTGKTCAACGALVVERAKKGEDSTVVCSKDAEHTI